MLKPTIVNRYFIAILPTEPLVSEIMKVKQYFVEAYGSKGALRSPAHLTLHMPFLWKAKKEAQLINLLAQTTNVNPFNIQLDGFGAFPPKAIFIKNKPSTELNAFQEQLTRFTWREMKLFNPTHNRGFHPHITVAFRDLKKEGFYKAWPEFEHKRFEGEIEVNSFWLLKHDGKQWHPFHEFVFKPEN